MAAVISAASRNDKLDTYIFLVSFRRAELTDHRDFKLLKHATRARGTVIKVMTDSISYKVKTLILSVIFMMQLYLKSQVADGYNRKKGFLFCSLIQ